MHYLVAGHGYWGHGDTLEIAKRNFRAEGGRLTKGYEVITFDDETEFQGVDQMGRYHYVGNAPTKELHEPRNKPRKP